MKTWGDEEGKEKKKEWLKNLVDLIADMRFEMNEIE